MNNKSSEEIVKNLVAKAKKAQSIFEKYNQNKVNEVVTAVAINGTGAGYQVGDVLTVDNSDAKVTRGSGLKFVVNVIFFEFLEFGVLEFWDVLNVWNFGILAVF